jgi:hypothetical protein
VAGSSATACRFGDVGLFDEQLPACEDYDLWLRITCHHPVLLVDQPLVEKHGGHSDQLSRTVSGLDRYRIRALVKILGSGCLEAGDRAATVSTLEQKCRIWADGAETRGRLEEAARYRDLARRWRQGTPTSAANS